MSVPTNLRFSDSRSFRLFTEGLQALQSYERSAKPDALRKAAGKFEECVNDYQQDVLPHLYLGIVKTYQGESLKGAISLLQDVVDRNIPEVTATAKYYLAEAHVAKYSPDDFDRANTLLKEIATDAKTSPLDRLRADSLRIFTQVRERVWKNRGGPVSGAEQKTADDAASDLEDFRKRVEGSDIPENLRAALMADYWNSAGLLKEYQAHKAAEQGKAPLIQESLDAYEKASHYGANRADALSNQARVYFDLKDDSNTAITLCKQVLELRAGDSFAHLLLGRIYKKKNLYEHAIEHFLKAMAKFTGEGALQAGQCYEASEDSDAAVDMYEQVPEVDKKRYPEAQDAIQRLKYKS